MSIRSFLRILGVVLSLLLAGPSGVAHAAAPPAVVLISGEVEYSSMITLPALKDYLEQNHGLKCVYLERTGGEDIPGLEAIDRADLVILCIRRMTLPGGQLDRIKRYVGSGRPLLGFRTASHAFENWKEWDNEVLGGNYHGHHGNTLVATARVNPEATGHPILRGVAAEFVTGGSLYKASPLKTPEKPLLIGSIAGQPPEPLAWTHRYHGGRIFYTSLGDPKDFTSQPFMQLMINTVFWALDKPAPTKAAKPITTFPVKQINLGQFEPLAKHRSYTIVDVRDAREFAAGHVARAINLDASASDFATKVKQLEKDKPCVLYSRGSAQSAKAAQTMHELGCKFVYDFTGGLSEWEKAGRKVVK